MTNIIGLDVHFGDGPCDDESRCPRTYTNADIVKARKLWYEALLSSPPENTWEEYTPEQQAEYFISLLKQE